MNNRSQGQIITFYSYKGGTGRSMSLANVACLLAEREDITPGKGVLMMDWDLEAPGLHRYFFNRLEPRKRAEDSRGTGICDAEPGLIDLFYKLNEKIDSLKTQSAAAAPEMFSEEIARKIFEEVDLERYIIPTSIRNLSLMKAGRFNPKDTNEYPERVNKFNWETLYNKSPQLIRVFAEVLSEKFDYVLIDSRTGVTDISGVCTMLLPEKLVIVFTPNMQSLMGAVDVVRRATEYRKESDDLRSLIVFPLVSRVESSETDLRHDWRAGNTSRNIIGYQAEFEKVIAEAYGKDVVDLDVYFNEMQIQHVPRYAYGEEIAVLEERTEDKFSLRRSYKTFADKLIEHGLPWEEMPSSLSESATSDIVAPPAVAVQHRGGNRSIVAALAAVCGILIVLLLFVWFNPANKPQLSVNSAPQPSPEAEKLKLPASFDNLYLGIVAGRSLTLALKREGQRLTGSASSSKAIESISGTIDDNGNFRVESFNSNNKSVGIFSGHIDVSGIVTGQWTRPGGERMRPFSMALNRGVSATVNAPLGSLTMQSERGTNAGKKLLQIPNGTQIIIVNCDDEAAGYAPDGALARWCVARHEGQTGWVFDAFLNYGSAAPDS